MTQLGWLGRKTSTQTNIEIGPVASDKDISKVFYIGKISPVPPPPGGHVFWQIMMAWTILVESHIRNIPAKLYCNQSSGFWLKDF